MKLEGFGVQLEILTAESAETVRLWRNRPEILVRMEFQQQISQEKQQQWFSSIRNNPQFLYLLILAGNQPVGMIHLAGIRQGETAEAGLFIGNPDFTGTGITLGASVLLLDYAFGTLQLQTVTAKIKDDNLTAQQYNQLLGFQKEQALKPGFSEWKIEKEAYLIRREKLIQWISPHL